MRNIKKIKNLKGKTILLRVDFNLPIKDGKIEDDFRVKKALPTIKFLKNEGAKIILITHLGKGGDSLSRVAEVLNRSVKVKFVEDIIGPEAEKSVKEMKNGEIILLENLRNNDGEKSCDKNFAKKLASMAEIYVNEAFSVSHRKDASIVLLPKILPCYAGIQFEEEVKNLSHAFKNPRHPFLFILGGAKFSTKIPLVKKYLKLADFIFVGGALSHDFLKAKGFEIGASLVDDTYNIKNILKNKKIILPSDVVVMTQSKKLVNKKINEIERDEIILDIGKDTIKDLSNYIKSAKLILWNGPLGKYEDGGAKGTENILKSVASSKAESIIGGGDTVALISKLKIEKNFSFVSTGGGSTLDYLANGTLVGIKALQ